MINLGVLISGGGSNLQAIIDAVADGALDASIKLVVSSKNDVYGLTRAEQAGIPTLALTKDDYVDPLAADERIASALLDAQVDYVVMAGYMRMVREPLLKAFPNKIINLHPALLPSFPGAHGIADAFDYGVKLTGVTIHFANEAYDEGAIIAQEAVAVAEDDTLESLEEKIHAVEHKLYPQALQLLAQGCVVIGEDGKVRIL
ncbi:MAG: phosphoribosylglycinamide formyltransferase [Coriobacteriia bacterium]|nr:phosphoribosylglycinamide formyltransferase [Coriobacteriia bacterium]MCL2749941.1 phosphoribosylglycinamide formyltransferase [Coriobacteriia bacterium]